MMERHYEVIKELVSMTPNNAHVQINIPNMPKLAKNEPGRVAYHIQFVLPNARKTKMSFMRYATITQHTTQKQILQISTEMFRTIERILVTHATDKLGVKYDDFFAS